MTKNTPTILHGDMRDVLKELPENSFDAVVTDPPYHLTSIVKRFSNTNESDDTITSKRTRERSDGYARLVAGGFMGQKWDGGNVAFKKSTWRRVYRVLKPGAHLLSFGGTRTYHRMACAIENAGFEIRDCVLWIYGSGFPKSYDVSQSIEKLLTIGKARRPDRDLGTRDRNRFSGDTEGTLIANTGGKVELTTEEAKQYAGFGTALKPACEMIVLARKPLSEKTVAANVLKWGTGALNIDGGRIGTEGGTKGCNAGPSNGIFGDGLNGSFGKPVEGLGRFPANVIHDGSEEAIANFPQSKSQESVLTSTPGNIYGGGGEIPSITGLYGFNDEGSAARFFYTSKADKMDRQNSTHPCIKPVDLIAYLCRLITPPKGVVLDPFAGSGTTGMACMREGFSCTMIERESKYVEDIKNRIKHVSGADLPLFEDHTS